MSPLKYDYSRYMDLHDPMQNPNQLPTFSNREISSNEMIDLAIQHGNNVKSLSFGVSGNRQFSPERVSELLATCQKCEELDFSFCDWINDHDLKAIAKSCQNKQIQKIHLNSLDKITVEGLKCFNQVNSLKSIRIQQCIKINELPKELRFSVQLENWLGYEI